MKINVGYFSHTNFSPSETFINDLLYGLIECKDLNIIYVSGQSNTPKIDLNIPLIKSGYFYKYNKLSKIAYNWGNLLFNRGEQLQMHIDKIKSSYLLKKNKLPQLDVAYVEYATSAVLLMEYFDLNNIPFIVHVHGYDITSSRNNYAYASELNKLFSKAKAIVVASNYMKRRLILQGCEESKLKMVRIGVNEKSIIPLSWETRTKSSPNIVYLGRMTEKKNPIALLHSFNIVKKVIPNVHLNMIGDGYLMPLVKETIKQLDIENAVTLHGSLNRKQSFPILNSSWVYAQHSVTAINGDTEGFAISIAEAALHELPVVSTIHNGITENVIDRTSGYLVPEYDYEAMAEKIIFLIKNPNIAESMGKAGRKYIIKICNVNNRVLKIEELLKCYASNAINK
jgi:glycosyltransferase involved in cell wall biosynthesis